MSKPVTMTDIEFVQLPELTQKNHLYLYRDNSALLRAAVRARVIRGAELDGRELKDISTCSQRVVKPRPLVLESQNRGSASAARDRLTGSGQSDASAEPSENVLLPSLHVTVAEVSLFGDTLTVHDLGDRTLKHPPLDDVETALDLIARDAALQSLCLFVPDTHEVVKTDAWRAAVETTGFIEEPMVTLDNYLAVARSYFPQSRLGNLGHLSDNRRFLTRLRKFVEQGTCTPFELSIQIDMIVLGEMEGGEFREAVEAETKRARRLVLPETLRRFLDNRDSVSFSALMQLIDGLHHDRMLEPNEVLTRLYRATTATLESRDRRYRRLEDPLHCVWAALLLANEHSFLNGNAFVAMDYLCQRYCREAAGTMWFSDNWQAIAPLLEITATDEPSRLDKARLELQRALRARLKAMKGGEVDWFHLLVRLSEVRGATDSLNEQLPMEIGEAD
ncbi:hypothetical protein ACQR2B_29180 [Bradyrhizobium oligotrophicum]|uniref:hypothetical protein n=1 Tax=Bradyrhizobium TaxID=374 RepID=UPI003EB7BF48